jgi:glucose/arabinose dehydrogenase
MWRSPGRALNKYIAIILLAAVLVVAFVPPDAAALNGQDIYFPWIARAPGLPSVSLANPIGDFDQPVHIANAGDGSNRLFVVEQRGRILIVQNGARLPVPFLDIRDRVSCCGERGLFSVAFPPGYAAKGYFYVNYTDLQGDTVVARYHLTANPHVADPTSEQVVFTADQPYENHNGGQLAFGPQDGYLYIGMGDGGSGGDPENRAQNPLEPLGKILRIDVESGVAPYAIPPTNPFVGNPAYLPEIWALGLRNPWRFSFDRLTADLYIADVGQQLYEEVDYQKAGSPGGENYGWRIMEGDQCYGATVCDRTGLTMPIATYDHSEGCSVTGGVVYRGTQQGGLQGAYLFGDFCSGRIWGLRREGAGWIRELLHQPDILIASFGEDEQGEVYVTDFGNGRIYHIVAATP